MALIERNILLNTLELYSLMCSHLTALNALSNIGRTEDWLLVFYLFIYLFIFRIGQLCNCLMITRNLKL